ncbi:DUF2313 domain-containing protein [Salmonella enterica]|uniref:YmfQ family protein n=1 Tax=Salmonella enterica TaxID=28901 RepID=UPI0003BD40ED|nr:putative phage tail protein [Salmonella enterica]ECS7051519.1 DUF2313 domain-containing protein [Salmonella enterica subsp. enterica serovar Oranienburg]AUM42053.1 phage tail protein [Salmonella enterica subsp. enterica serovar Poona str. ATCC BAA-1673]EBN1525812.1 DUF2313 domain-containing protein [Salmonella enterica]EBS9186018.1 DUF2313 domain-containing protein [Salmonella enterica]EEE1618223.1 DUF2313 domain-containing protein [Salmonella enterica subsp. enterica serovar Oranienburg]
MNADDYRDVLALLLPPVSYDSNGPRLGAELQAEAALLSRSERAIRRLLTAITLTTSVDFLPDWERLYALTPSPDDTLQQRCQRVLAKISETGGLSREYFIQLAKTLGYDITITEPEPFRCGRNRCGDRLWIREIIWVWIVKINSGNKVPVYHFRCGRSATGERLLSFGYNALEHIFNELKPAHTQVVFDYSENAEE